MQIMWRLSTTKNPKITSNTQRGNYEKKKKNSRQWREKQTKTRDEIESTSGQQIAI